MPKCSYCGKQYENPRGLTLVMTNGQINYLCSGKCRKNMLMKRRKVRWVQKMEQNKILKKEKYAKDEENKNR